GHLLEEIKKQSEIIRQKEIKIKEQNKEVKLNDFNKRLYWQGNFFNCNTILRVLQLEQSDLELLQKGKKDRLKDNNDQTLTKKITEITSQHSEALKAIKEVGEEVDNYNKEKGTHKV